MIQLIVQCQNYFGICAALAEPITRLSLCPRGVSREAHRVQGICSAGWSQLSTDLVPQTPASCQCYSSLTPSPILAAHSVHGLFSLHKIGMGICSVSSCSWDSEVIVLNDPLLKDGNVLDSVQGSLHCSLLRCIALLL